jgi:Protoporphyrinogen oxidase
MNRIAVLGGGVSGVVLAKRLADKGIAAVDLIEKEERLGGLHRSIRVENLTFDIGAFLFSQEHELLKSFPTLYDCFVPVHPVSLSVTPSGNVCQYPITLQSYLRDNGLMSLLSAVPDMLVSRICYRKRDTVPCFAKYYMGGQIYRRSGLQSYIERLYGIKDEEVGLEFAMQRLRDVQLYTPIALARRKLLGMLHKPATSAAPAYTGLVRPLNGFEEVYNKIASSLTRQGIAVRLGCAIKSVKRRERGGYEIDFGDHTETYSRVVSTLPIPVMLRLLGTAAKVRFEHVSLLSLFYRGRVRHDASFLYNFTSRGKWKRITLFSNFYGKIGGSDYFTVEITTQDTSPQHLEMLRADFETHADALSLCEPDVPLQYLGSIVTERAYPLFQRGKSQELQAERDRLTAAGIDFVGRQGNFAYLSSHAAAQQAACLAATID